MQRGDELLAVSPTAAGLDDPANQIAVMLVNGTLDPSLGSSRPGEMKYFRLRKPLGGPVDTVMSASAFSLDPVPNATAPIILDAGGGHKVGYLLLRSFVDPAIDPLRRAIGAFRSAGVTDLIVDFRYNGGGSLEVARTLLNLLRPGPPAGEVMFEFSFNAFSKGENSKILFGPEPNAFAPGKIAFIVTDRSASASETVVNALQPYYGTSLALVGGRTYGKPVAMGGYGNPACDWVLLLVDRQVLNATGTGDYFGGLPDAHFTGVSIQAADDLNHAMGDPAEASTAAALNWIATGANPGPIPAADQQRPAANLLHTQPNLVQTYVPGLF